jgi:formyl-CoA transferase
MGLNLQGAIAGLDPAACRDMEGWSNPIQNVYTTKDLRHLFISVQNISWGFPRLLKVLGKAEWLEEEIMQSVKPLFKNRFNAIERLAEAFAQLDAETVCAGLDEAGTVHSLVYKNAEVLNDPQLIENGLMVPFDSGKPDSDKTFSTAFQLIAEEQRTPKLAPEIGQHSRSILREYC